MIPLRSSLPVSRIHPIVYVMLGVWSLGQVLRWIYGAAFLVNFAVVPAKFSVASVITAGAFHESGFSTFVALLYFWVFGPSILLLFRPVILVLASLAATVISLYLFAKLHPESAAPILASDAWLGFFLGAFMRKDIWGNVDTLVIGPFWLRVFSVPSYVLLFFWFFYLLIGNLVMDPPFSDAPMLYLIPLLGFLLGFTYASFRWTWRRALGT